MKQKWRCEKKKEKKAIQCPFKMAYQTSCDKVGHWKEGLQREWKGEKIGSDGKGEVIDLKRENGEGEKEALESWEKRRRQRL